MRSKSIDFNSVLGGANVLVAGLLVTAWWRDIANEYVDQQSLVLAVLLCFQTQVALWIERRRRDPFVILLAFGTVLYYSLRLFTLTIYPFSVVFDRFAYTAADTNYALAFILIANVALYAGLYVVRIKDTSLQVDSGSLRARSPFAVLILMLISFLVTYFGGVTGQESRILAIASLVLSPPIIVAMALTYFLLFRQTLNRGFAISCAVLILAEIVAHTLWGSRSAIVSFVQSFILIALAVNGSIRMRRSYLGLGLAALPVAVVVLVAAFTLSTSSRESQATGTALDLTQSLRIADDVGSTLLSGPLLDLVVPPVLARAGFFDFSAEIIAHRDEYAPVLNLTAYYRSVVDNILTPGFDVFDQPKIANSLLFVYRGWGTPSKLEVDNADVYQSDQLGIYGEFYALFGYASLPLLFLLAFGLKWAYVAARNSDPFMLAMQRVIVLSIFQRSLDSFGFDWTIGEILPLIAGVILYSTFFSSCPVRRISMAEAST